MDWIALNSALAHIIQIANGFLTNLCQLLALFVIAVGIGRAMVIYVRDILFKNHTSEAFQSSRLAMGYAFSLGLSFLIGASILRTMISSQWFDIAQLALIIAIRTVLNLLLERAIRIGNSHQLDEPVPNQTLPVFDGEKALAQTP
jgi:uncharacterized membrane protein